MKEQTKIKEESEWKEVRGGELFEFKNPGDSAVGELVDVRVEIGEFKSTMYDFTDAKGNLRSFFGSTVLDGKMKRVKIGQVFKATFKGKVKAEKGNREYKDFEVFVRG